MGYYVHLHVAFACDENEGVAKLAQHHLDLLGPDAPIEVHWFLGDLANRSGKNRGPKGGLSLWGIVGNYTNGEEFCEVLRSFWNDLLREVPGGPFDFEHVLVFEEREQSGCATAFEIIYDEDRDIIEIKRHENLPFSWHQM